MKNLRFLGVLVLVGGLVAVLFVANPSTAQVKKGKTRPALTKYLMRGVTKVHCGALKKGLDAGPSDDKAWEDLTMHAMLLNELSYILMADGRCPDGVWAKAATKTLRQGSADVLKAVEAKDVDAAKEAFGSMTKACGSCHKAHKKKK